MEQITYQKKLEPNGYISIKTEEGWILEHRYIVEQYLGIKLLKTQSIHHINGIKSDNRITNLMLFNTQKEHKSFENKVTQFGFTNPVKEQIKNRWAKWMKKQC